MGNLTYDLSRQHALHLTIMLLRSVLDRNEFDSSGYLNRDTLDDILFLLTGLLSTSSVGRWKRCFMCQSRQRKHASSVNARGKMIVIRTIRSFILSVDDFNLFLLIS